MKIKLPKTGTGQTLQDAVRPDTSSVQGKIRRMDVLKELDDGFDVDIEIGEPDPPGPDFKQLVAEIEAIDTAVDFNAPSNLAELKTALKAKFQKIEAKQQKIIAYLRANLK